MAATPSSKSSSSKAKSTKTAGGTSSSKNKSSDNNTSNTNTGFVTKYFLIILFCFACLSLFLNTRFASVITDEVSTLEQVLQDHKESGRGGKGGRGGGITAISSERKRKKNEHQKNHHRHPLNAGEATTSTGGGGGVDGGGEEEHEGGQEHEDEHLPHEKEHVAVNQHNIHELNCEKWGGPSNEFASQEMKYWKDIPNDADHISPFHQTLTLGGQQNNHRQGRQFMTFEPDQGGWNNIRMAMETVLAMAFAMGRTLVLPPHQQMYLLGKREKGQNADFSFEHFFHMESISQEHIGLDIIPMTEFLEDYVMTGKLSASPSSQRLFPPKNRTNWDGASRKELKDLYAFLRNNITSEVVMWDPEKCVAAFPKSTTKQDMDDLRALKEQIKDSNGKFPQHEQFVDHPTPVDAPPVDRLKENWADREDLCIYDEQMQKSTWVHFPMSHDGPMANRLLVHFYAFLFFQDWQQDLKMKRFVRDHVRYVDEIQCAAARVVEGMRQHVLKKTDGKSSEFDSLHVRRGDFQYKVTRADAPDIFKQTTKKIPDGTTVYIATDERDKSFFDPLKEHYDVLFLDDFINDKLGNLNTNYYGMVDQLVASRGRIFFGCWFSTFTGYINRLRGYHHHQDNYKTPKEKHDDIMGIVPSWYYAVTDRYDHMQHFWPVKKSYYAREFPTSWRLIDTGAAIPVDDQ